MLKKIIAAAAASTLAVSALAATTASADAAKVVYTANRVDKVTVTLKGEASAAELNLTAPLKDGKKDSDQEYSEIKVKVTNNFTTTTNSGKVEKLNVTGGKATVNLEGKANVIDKVNASAGTVTFKDSDVKTDASADFAAATLKNGKELKEISVKPSFGLTDKNDGYKILKSLDASKTKITTELTLELTEAQFNSLMDNTLFDEYEDIWEDTRYLTTMEEDFTDALADGISVSSVPLTVEATKKADGAKATPIATTWKITKMDVKTTPSLGFAREYQISAGINPNEVVNDETDEWSRADLRAFVNGGKAEFKFNRNITGKEWVDGVIYFRNGNRQNDVIKTDYTESGDTLIVDFPKNFTYNVNGNDYPSVFIGWNFDLKNDDTLDDLELISITFTANEAATPDNGNNGGLVEDDKSKPTDSKPADSTPSTPSNDNTNSGSNKGDNANPSTGVAMAVAPVALAAAAAAVVISKKRK